MEYIPITIRNKSSVQFIAKALAKNHGSG